MVSIRIIAFWYQTKPMCINWCKVNSDYFNVSSSVRQGVVLPPKSFAIYHIFKISQIFSVFNVVKNNHYLRIIIPNYFL